MSGSDSESNRSLSPSGPAPTPGYGLDKSRSNSPNFETQSHASGRSGSRQSSRSGSAHSNRSSSRSKSRSPSPGSNKSGSPRSQSAGSNRSRSQSRGSIRSETAGSNHSGSPVSNRSRSRSKSADSNRSNASNKSGSVRSATSNRSKSKSPGSNRSRSRSKSAGSNRSRSHSKSIGSNKSRSRSKSAGSLRSRSRSVGSNKSRSPSRSRSGSPVQNEKKKHSDDETTKKKIRLIDSDSDEGSENKDDNANAEDLFGDADDISSEDEGKGKEASDKEQQPEQSRSDEEQHKSDEETQRRSDFVLDEDDKENEPEMIPETRIDVRIPKISCDLGREIHFVKLPNFLSVETRPFDPQTYEDEIDEEETLDEEGRARLKLKVENTIRWRDIVNKEGDLEKESNARMVRWSDGSLSLHLGSEIFDVYKQPLQGDHNHLFIRQGTGLQGQAVFRTKLSFRPHSTESFTHRKMTLSLADRSQKTTGIKILSQVGLDPDQDRKTLLKKEEEKLRQTVRNSAKVRRRGEGGSRSHSSGNVYREEDGSDEEGAISLNAIKNKYKSGAALSSKGGAIYSSDEEGSDFEARRSRKLDKPIALKDSESSEQSE